MIAWVCAECEAKNPASAEGRFCRACGSPRNGALGESKAKEPEYLPPWQRLGWKPSTPEDRCTEPGCTKTVREHIEEFRAIVSRPGTLFTREPVIDTAEREALLRAQAALLRAQPPDAGPC